MTSIFFLPDIQYILLSIFLFLFALFLKRATSHVFMLMSSSVDVQAYVVLSPPPPTISGALEAYKGHTW